MRLLFQDKIIHVCKNFEKQNPKVYTKNSLTFHIQKKINLLFSKYKSIRIITQL